MNGGTISGNEAGNSGGDGGGVNVGASGTFRMTIGTIYGNESTIPEADRNTLTASGTTGASLYTTGTATYGPAPNGTGTNLTTRNTTIRVVNGAIP
jgi:hypothetical protein